MALSIQERKARRSKQAKRQTANFPETLQNPYFLQLLKEYDGQVATMAAPRSQMCTAEQFGEPDYIRIAQQLGLTPRFHRKQWEFAYIYRSLEAAGQVRPGSRGLVFGVGREKLPSRLAAEGCSVVATDLPVGEGDGNWVGGPQHTASLDGIFHEKLIARDLFEERVSFRPVNMMKIPEDLRDFDFCWSSCALEHLGSLDAGLDFIRNSIACLKPGGYAVHTTEFNLESDERTLDSGSCVVYRKRDLLAFQEQMRAAGHTMELTFHPGSTPTDQMIDKNRDSDIHLRLYVRNRIAATSIGLCIRKSPNA